VEQANCAYPRNTRGVREGPPPSRLFCCRWGCYVSELAPDFAYVHWRDEYELAPIEGAYARAFALTDGFKNVSVEQLSEAIQKEPSTLRIFRLLLGLTTQEFAASTVITAEQLSLAPLTNGVVKAMESGRGHKAVVTRVAASAIDQAMRGELFAKGAGGVRSKIDKPDTADGWNTVRKYATENVPFPIFLHQRHYGGAFRQLLDATSGKRGDILEDVVEELFTARRIPFVRTGPSNATTITEKFGLTVKPAPDFVIHDKNGTLRAMLECKQANDGGTARDKAARFSVLRSEGVRLGGVPVFAVLAGLGWRRTADTLGPVIRDTDGRVFTAKTLTAMVTVEPLSGLTGETAT
jgi:hypothetical protein